MLKKLKVPLLLGFLVLVALGAAAFRQRGGNDPPAILEIRKEFSGCQALRGQKSTRRVALRQVAAGPNDKGRWQTAEPNSDETQYANIDIFLVQGKIRVADLTEDTPSGDWQQVTGYCFRTDGSLAFSLSTLSTFHGNVKVESRLYFDETGKSVRLLRSIFDLKTNKPLAKNARSFMDRNAPVYMTAEKLVEEVGRSNIFK